MRLRLPRKLYKTVLLDPPWGKETGGGKIKRGADKHYALMSNTEIVDTVVTSSLWNDVSADAHCYMWATNSCLLDGLHVMKTLGFRYITTITWLKTKKDVKPGGTFELGRQGLGRYFCGRTEQLLFGVRGKAMVPEPIDRGSTIILAPRREHSRKPREQYALIEKVSPGGYLEYFARGSGADGWDVRGNEAT